MSCCQQHRPGAVENPATQFILRPDAPCVFCAEKHLSYAWRLAAECGYAEANRQAIVGELYACEAHLFSSQQELAGKVRAARHLVQYRREGEIAWEPLMIDMDALVQEELKK